MKTKEEIEKEIVKLQDQVFVHLDEQRESNFTIAVASMQEIINSKLHRINQLKWVLKKD